ncbi:hypothetical protein [Sulfolobus spindle-shaped virus]|nr:hypothetical protein [Sulfolobus spindle-shaped virus]AZG03726.1 hypothetical protein [Sulfolobus spindle-shaped virus]AZG03878.1 hypothetical protein [Sulfolobus spindle-shaped virus]AZG04013.1 hypothetical protein [Sulfolobus spindle-shaped virus]AZG04067.1 hypothetical protein [Sulfolobus spindle-shaped virus]
MGYNKVVLATIRGSLGLIKQSIENDDVETAIKLARYFKLKFEDKSDKVWWYRQWHSVMESVEHRLREGLVELAYQTLEQAEFQLSVMTSPIFSKASVKQSKA